MTILQAVFLGIVQGTTEFLPISSSGHLILMPELFGWEAQGFDFDVMIHLATLLAIIWMMRADILNVLKGLFKKDSKFGQLGWKIAIATIPVVIFGLALSGSLDSVRTLKIVAINLVIWGAILWAADWYSVHVNHKTKGSENIKWWQAIAIGAIQALALLPGSSRSGLTMSAGLFSGLDRITAARFSFLLSIPAIAGAGVFAGMDVVENGFSTPIVPMIFGFLAAFVAGSFAIKFLLKFLVKADFKWFAVYRIILGLILFFWVAG